MSGEEEFSEDSCGNLPLPRSQGNPLDVNQSVGEFVSRVAGDAYKHLQASEDCIASLPRSLNFLMEAIPSLGVAANCLIQQNRKHLTAKQIAIVRLETLASLRSDEIGSSIYSETLQEVANLLKSERDINSAIFWIVGARDSFLGFSQGLGQFATLQSLLRISASRSENDQPLEELQMAIKTRLGLYKQENVAEGVAMYMPLLRLVQGAKNWEEVSQLCRSVQMLNESLNLAKHCVASGSV